MLSVPNYEGISHSLSSSILTLHSPYAQLIFIPIKLILFHFLKLYSCSLAALFLMHTVSSESSNIFINSSFQWNTINPRLSIFSLVSAFIRLNRVDLISTLSSHSITFNTFDYFLRSNFGCVRQFRISAITQKIKWMYGVMLVLIRGIKNFQSVNCFRVVTRYFLPHPQ